MNLTIKDETYNIPKAALEKAQVKYVTLQPLEHNRLPINYVQGHNYMTVLALRTALLLGDY